MDRAIKGLHGPDARWFGKVKRKSIRQKAWDYMRRNRVFRVGDILMILEISENSLSILLRQLTQAKYIKMVERKQAFVDKKYKLLLNTGVTCPSVLSEKKEVNGKMVSKPSKFLYDSNIHKKVFMGKEDD